VTLKAKYLPVNKEETLNAQGLKAWMYLHAVKGSTEELINDEGEIGHGTLFAEFITKFESLPRNKMNRVLDFLHALEEKQQIIELIKKELE
tara:strand:- start:338 stop:610 length:273 start_codon:yes stop_codon:yes gene_type:complete